MAIINLSQNKIAIVDDADFDYLNQWKWHARLHSGIWYAVRTERIKGTKKRLTFRMHRVILGLTDSTVFCDHKDHDGLNNQRSNLRVATRSQNARNKTSARNSTSSYLGVFWHAQQKRWRAKIYIDKKYIHLGNFKNEKDAAEAYNKRALAAYGKFANLNVI